MTETRELAKQAATAAAFDIGQTCPTCNGEGKLPGGRKVIHTISGAFGADWDLAKVLDEIDAADEVGFIPERRGHNLYTRRDGRRVFFEVRQPDGTDGGPA